MSIASEISRIRQNVEDSLSAVEDKGVTVPAGSTSDDLPGLIALIQGGGIIINDTIDEHGGTVREITAANVIRTQARTGITPTESSQTITPTTGYDAMTSVQINPIPSSYVQPAGNLAITENGTGINVAQYATVSVDVAAPEPSLQAKTVSPTESNQTVTPDSGYDGLSSVQVGAISSTYVGSGIIQKAAATYNPSETAQEIAAGQYLSGKQTISAIPSNYVGSGITRRSGTDLTASGATVSVPAGYYAEAASKSVASGSAATPTTTITANPTISVSSSGLITASVSGSQNVTPTVSAGYVSSGTAGTVSVSGSKTQQLTTKAAATITPGTTAQTIAAGTYLTGTQTIAGDSNLVSGNIISGKSIFGVQGGVTFQTYYTGSSTPASSLGVNGDIYLKT